MSTSARRCLTGWIACFAILLHTFAPGVSHALAAARGEVPIDAEICSAAGLGQATPRAIDGPGQRDGTVAVQHCPYCASDTGSVGPVSAPGTIAAAITGTMAMPPRHDAVVVRRLVRPSSYPRAPPRTV